MTGKFKARFAAVLLLVFLVAGIKYLASGDLLSSQPSEGIYTFDSFAMGGILSVKVKAGSREDARKSAEAARQEVTRLHKIFDTKDPQSEISRLNASRGNGRAVELSLDMSRVLSAALRVRDISGGAFEPALGEVVDLWGFSDERRQNRPPEYSAVRALLDSTDLSREVTISADGRAANIGPRSGRLELGGIAQGYAVDRAVQVLREAGVRNALVNLTGEIGVLGVGSDGASWRVGVQHPRKRDSHLGAVKLDERMTVATSGDYERFFVENGKRYHHILDASTGYSADSGVVGITVLAPDCMTADAMATAAFILGPEKGIALLERENCEGLIIYAEDGRTEGGKLLMAATNGFSKYLPNPDLEGLPLP